MPRFVVKRKVWLAGEFDIVVDTDSETDAAYMVANEDVDVWPEGWQKSLKITRSAILDVEEVVNPLWRDSLEPGPYIDALNLIRSKE